MVSLFSILSLAASILVCLPWRFGSEDNQQRTHQSHPHGHLNLQYNPLSHSHTLLLYSWTVMQLLPCPWLHSAGPPVQRSWSQPRWWSHRSQPQTYPHAPSSCSAGSAAPGVGGNQMRCEFFFKWKLVEFRDFRKRKRETDEVTVVFPFEPREEHRTNADEF